MDSIVSDIKRTYYDSVYRVTKVALGPVVAAISDVLRESVTEAFREGIHDAITSTDFFGELIFGKKRRK